FRAEDGIRDPLVTGVQTCALPIWGRVVMLGASGLMLAMASVRSAATGTGTPSDVPMSRPGDCLAVLDGIAHHASWAEAPDGSLRSEERRVGKEGEYMAGTA